MNYLIAYLFVATVVYGIELVITMRSPEHITPWTHLGILATAVGWLPCCVLLWIWHDTFLTRWIDYWHTESGEPEPEPERPDATQDWL